LDLRDEVTGRWKKMQEELHNLYFSTNIRKTKEGEMLTAM
jgi:hypothetical protein